jgi:hypothetical protein
MKEAARNAKKQDKMNIFKQKFFPLTTVQYVYVTCSYYRVQL